MNFGKISLLLLLGAFAPACTTMTSAQSGRTVGDGGFRAYTGLTAAPLPALELDLRYGLTENLELGGGLALPGNFHGRLKYALYDASWFSLGIGAAGSYLTLSGEGTTPETDPNNPGTTNTTTQTTTKFSLTNTILSVPFYMGFHIADTFAIILTPRVGYSMVSLSGSVNDDSAKGYAEGLYYGNELGFIIGRSWGMNISFGVYNGLPGAQVGLGFFIGAENNPSIASSDSDEQPTEESTKPRKKKKKREKI